jgi:hypothetical protein
MAGAQIGRRIPKEFRAPYRNILVNICKEQDKQARLGNHIEMRRIEQLLIMVQAMLHRIPTGEMTCNEPRKMATLRAKQLHSRYFAFTQGRFTELLEKDDMLEKGDPAKEGKSITPNNRSWVERRARSNSRIQPNWQMRPSRT